MIRGPIVLAALALAAPALAAAGDTACASCLGGSDGRELRPLRVEIESGLQFSRLALMGPDDGQAEIDPKTGTKRVTRMIDLGGLSWQGKARITGEPLHPVRISLPPRIVLRAPDGSQALLTDFVTDLPPVAMLKADGTLTFAFGARLTSENAVGGAFRGRILIEVEYD